MLTKSLKVTLLPRLHQHSHFQALKPVHISFVLRKNSCFFDSCRESDCKAAKGSSNTDNKGRSLSFGYDAVTKATGMHRGYFYSHLFHWKQSGFIYPGALQVTTQPEMVMTYPEMAEPKHLEEKAIVSALRSIWWLLVVAIKILKGDCCLLHPCPPREALTFTGICSVFIFEVRISEALSDSCSLCLAPLLPPRFQSSPVKSGCCGRKYIPGEAKCSLLFAGTLSVTAGLKALLKDFFRLSPSHGHDATIPTRKRYAKGQNRRW